MNAGPLSPWPLVALFTGAAAIGVGPILVRLSEVGPCAAAWWRMAFALPVFGLWVLLEPRAVPAPRRGLLFAGVLFAVDLSLFHWGIALTTVTNSTLLSNVAPVFVTIGAWWLFRQPVGWSAIGALVLALGGAAVLVLGKSHVAASAAHPALGDGLSFIAAFAYAAYQLTVTRVRQHATTAEFMWWSSLACAVVVGAFAVVSGDKMLPSSGHGWLAVVALALVAQVLGQGLITWALKHLPQAFSTVALLFQPLVAALIAWPLFGEVLTPVQLIGAALLIGGVMWSRMSLVRRVEAPLGAQAIPGPPAAAIPERPVGPAAP